MLQPDWVAGSGLPMEQESEPLSEEYYFPLAASVCLGPYSRLAHVGLQGQQKHKTSAYRVWHIYSTDTKPCEHQEYYFHKRGFRS